MKNRSVLLLRGLAVACLLAVCPRPAAAYIKVDPLTLGNLCRQSAHIYVLKVEKVSTERGVILFKSVEQLKGKPDGTAAKHVIGPKVKGAKVILDWAAEGKTAIMFCNVEGGYGRGHACIDGYWYWLTYERGSWSAGAGEPAWLTQYCGTADKLRDALVKILRGEEVVVPGMLNGSKEDLEERRAKVQDLRASLKILDNDSRNAGGDKRPDLVGTVKALSGDGKSFTLLSAPMKKNPEPIPIGIQISERTTITAGKLAAGQAVAVWLEKGSANVAATIQIGKPPKKSK